MFCHRIKASVVFDGLQQRVNGSRSKSAIYGLLSSRARCNGVGGRWTLNEVTYEAATWGSGWKEAEQGSTVAIASFDN